MRSISNTDMEGEAAPALTSTAWVLADGDRPPNPQQQRVLAFFRPG